MIKKRFLPILLSVVITIMILVGCFVTLTNSTRHTTYTLDEGWDVTINHTLYENVTLSEFYKSYPNILKRGDHVTMTHALPDINDLPTPALIFRSRYTTLLCYINNKLIFQFGEEFYNNNKFLGKMYHVISLPSDYAGKNITLDMMIGEDDAFKALHPPILGSQRDITGMFVHDNLIIIATGTFMFVFGVVNLCIGLLFVTRIPDVKSLLFGALLCMNLSAWLMTYYNILSLFIYTEYETQIEYFTMYLILPYCFIILYYVLNLKGNRGFLALMAIGCGVPVIQYILQYAFNIHLRASLPIYHLTAILGVFVLFYFAIVTRNKSNVSAAAKIQMTGLCVFTISELLHLGIYYVDMFHIQYSAPLNRLVIALGCFIFAVCQLFTYLSYITDAYAKKQENISLSHLAYADGLTNLANRAKSDSLMDELNSATDDYCILSIDLNGLKDVNDKFGHPTGDRYIKDFSKVLTTTFGDSSFCARIGGDEFLVIIRDAETKDINSLIDRMNSALNVMNALYKEYHRSVATGFAFRHECDGGTSHNVYLLADQRMYEAKRAMHEELGIRSRL